jgi:sulfite reductase alpha subunit-like flavoprotein
VKKGDVRPPSDPSKPVIMVGPGTGLALFKAFLEERSHLAKHGTMTPPDRRLSIRLTVLRCALRVVRRVRCVLWAGVAVGENTFYFGCRHEKKDYLYGDLWQEMVAQGHLHHLHTAFSRDQVRHTPPTVATVARSLLTPNSRHTLSAGKQGLRSAPTAGERRAHVERARQPARALLRVGVPTSHHRQQITTTTIITIIIALVSIPNCLLVACRSAKQMPKDIKAALKEICKTQGNKTEEEAEEFFQQLRREKRYLEDTWD